MEGLLDKSISREESEEIFKKLKDGNSHQLLVDSIRSAERTSEKAILTAACWESGLDFTNYFLFFVELACSDDFQLSMEALTVVENCEGTVDEATLKKALEMAQSAKTPNEQLVHDLIENIKQRI